MILQELFIKYLAKLLFFMSKMKYFKEWLSSFSQLEL